MLVPNAVCPGGTRSSNDDDIAVRISRAVEPPSSIHAPAVTRIRKLTNVRARAILVFYLACGFLASVTHAVVNPNSTAPALGASGAIAGVMGCYMRLFPWARIVTVIPVLFFPFFFELPAIVVIGFWFAVQILNGAGALFITSTGGGIAYWAHIGGFLAGLLFGPLFVRSKQRYRPYYADEGIYGFDPMGRRRSAPAIGGDHAYL